MMFRRHREVRHAIPLLVTIVSAAITSFGGSAVASADPPITPAPPPIIGPLQYGPPGYGPLGVPQIPPARAGVTSSADTVDPGTPAPLPGSPASGTSGVQVSADAISSGHLGMS